MSTTFSLKSQLLRAFASVGALTVIVGGFFIPTHQALADGDTPPHQPRNSRRARR